MSISDSLKIVELSQNSSEPKKNLQKQCDQSNQNFLIDLEKFWASFTSVVNDQR